MTAVETTLRSSWKTGADFLAHLSDADPPQFFHPVPVDLGLPPAQVGALVSVVVVLEDREAEFHVHARVIDRRDGTVKHGLTLEVIPEERDRMEIILVAARGESLPYRRRRYDRLPCELACSLSHEDGRTWRGTTTNINEGGAHASVDDPLPEAGAVVSVTLALEADRTVTLRARVVDSISAGPQKGIGVEFQFSSVAQRDEVWDEVARLRGRSVRAKRTTGS